MCKPFENTKKTVEKFLDSKKGFSWDQLQDAVISENGSLYVAPGMTLGEYMETFEKKDIIYFDDRTNSFGFVNELKLRIKNHLDRV